MKNKMRNKTSFRKLLVQQVAQGHQDGPGELRPQRQRRYVFCQVAFLNTPKVSQGYQDGPGELRPQLPRRYVSCQIAFLNKGIKQIQVSTRLAG